MDTNTDTDTSITNTETSSQPLPLPIKNHVNRRYGTVDDDLSAEYDHLGSTPPRTRIRNKEKYRSNILDDSGRDAPRIIKINRRNTMDNINFGNTNIETAENKKAKRRSLKTLRGFERDLKLDIGKCKTCRVESAPMKTMLNIPTVVESCNRFMSLCSRPVLPPNKASSLETTEDVKPPEQTESDFGLPDSRLIFHKTFSLLIRMGNGDKTCKRAISVEEQIWQNELKDLIWLEVSAKKAGRTPTQQDLFLCNKRDTVPALLDKILNYKFESSGGSCRNQAQWMKQSSILSSDSGLSSASPSDSEGPPPSSYFSSKQTYTSNPLDTINEHLCVNYNNKCFHDKVCLSVDCHSCSDTVAKAMEEVSALLNSLAEAEGLYPSSKAMATYHPKIISEEFIGKTKAMCLWFNMVYHQRLKMLILKKLLITHRIRYSSNKSKHLDKAACDLDKAVNCSKSNTKVHFNLTTSASDLNSSCEPEDCVTKQEDENKVIELDNDDDNDVMQAPVVQIEITNIKTNASNLIIESIDCTDKSLLNVSNTNIQNIVEQERNADDTTRSPYESTDSSLGSVHSNESGFVSSVNDNHDEMNIHSFFGKLNVYDMNNLGDLTKLRLHYPDQISPYREFIEKMLKIRGIRKAISFLERLHFIVLKKARMTLEKYEDTFKPEEVSIEDPNDSNPIIEIYSTENGDENSDDDFEFEKHTRCGLDIEELKKEQLELRKYGLWSKENMTMQLPSYRSCFLFLSTLPLEIIHEYLCLKCETKTEKPSALSIRQLIIELREGLMIAIKTRTRFIRHVNTALMAESPTSIYRTFYDRVLNMFNASLDKYYKQYLSMLSNWASMEHLPRNTLFNEWHFNGCLAKNLPIAAAIAPLSFCCLSVRQLEGAAVRLQERVREVGEAVDSLGTNFSNEDNEYNNTIKWRILGVCRDMQCLLAEEREKALATGQFALVISKHLHCNALFREFRLKIFKAMASLQNVICEMIKHLEEATSPNRVMELEETDRPSVQSRTKEIVSQAYKFGFEFHKQMCRMVNDAFSPTTPITYTSISQNRRSKLARSDSITEYSHTSIEDNYYSLNLFTPTTNQEFTYPLGVKQDNSKKIEENATNSLSNNPWSLFPSFDGKRDEYMLTNINEDHFKNGIPGCEECERKYGKTEEDEGHDEVDAPVFRKAESAEKLASCEWEEKVSRGLVSFSKQWMKFAMERCERGRGLRPRWANHGLEFLMLTCDPHHTRHLTEEEFEELKAMMDSCISHVIGSSRASTSSNNLSTSTPPPQRTRPSIHSLQHQSSNRASQLSSPPTPPTEVFLSSSETNPDETVLIGKRMSALRELDCRRDASMRKAGYIGCVRQADGNKEHFRPRSVTFKWQRGIKIGQGRFGKVYTVVNTESGQMLAMKEVSLGIGDRKSVERAANELRILEGVMHPNLVRYYGVEIHKEEMLIFMELCVEGSLEAVIAEHNMSGGGNTGLPEQLIRKYTAQLVSAVKALHTRSIAHRDIKSGNIFLTEGGNCLKLGDFGSAAKIRANTTVPGELQEYVGTQAYMAPEVFMEKSKGYGRAADIWSLGCVVVEMASGKRPWSEYDSHFQIMFAVGTGKRPEIPSHLSKEGNDFCHSCLQHDPSDRCSIDTLAHHPFLKV